MSLESIKGDEFTGPFLSFAPYSQKANLSSALRALVLIIVLKCQGFTVRHMTQLGEHDFEPDASDLIGLPLYLRAVFPNLTNLKTSTPRICPDSYTIIPHWYTPEGLRLQFPEFPSQWKF